MIYPVVAAATTVLKNKQKQTCWKLLVWIYVTWKKLLTDILNLDLMKGIIKKKKKSHYKEHFFFISINWMLNFNRCNISILSLAMCILISLILATSVLKPVIH